jgi:large subunit ribosomal protein L20
MPRVKRGTISLKRRKNVLKKTKGYRHGRKSKERQAREAIFHAGNHAFAHRKDKKADFRQLWSVSISSRVKEFGLSYSQFIHLLKESKIALNRKMLAGIAKDHPEAFQKLIHTIKK